MLTKERHLFNNNLDMTKAIYILCQKSYAIKEEHLFNKKYVLYTWIRIIYGNNIIIENRIADRHLIIPINQWLFF